MSSLKTDFRFNRYDSRQTFGELPRASAAEHSLYRNFQPCGPFSKVPQPYQTPACCSSVREILPPYLCFFWSLHHQAGKSTSRDLSVIIGTRWRKLPISGVAAPGIGFLEPLRIPESDSETSASHGGNWPQLIKFAQPQSCRSQAERSRATGSRKLYSNPAQYSPHMKSR
ncbi:hypothetical protein B0H16DRAFT_1556059 [Mycena metata]|uniref:Uncharacterized protein n=1 Tax=Mycena metata TaxID=1033252 RepID=A0AAD7N5S2_9AGAR|nr:hypothetical protein B0H16DRAFT_1556059 [Mycena metata]